MAITLSTLLRSVKSKLKIINQQWTEATWAPGTEERETQQTNGVQGRGECILGLLFLSY